MYVYIYIYIYMFGETLVGCEQRELDLTSVANADCTV